MAKRTGEDDVKGEGRRGANEAGRPGSYAQMAGGSKRKKPLGPSPARQDSEAPGPSVERVGPVRTRPLEGVVRTSAAPSSPSSQPSSARRRHGPLGMGPANEGLREPSLPVEPPQEQTFDPPNSDRSAEPEVRLPAQSSVRVQRIQMVSVTDPPPVVQMPEVAFPAEIVDAFQVPLASALPAVQGDFPEQTTAPLSVPPPVDSAPPFVEMPEPRPHRRGPEPLSGASVLDAEPALRPARRSRRQNKWSWAEVFGLALLAAIIAAATIVFVRERVAGGKQAAPASPDEPAAAGAPHAPGQEPAVAPPPAEGAPAVQGASAQPSSASAPAHAADSAEAAAISALGAAAGLRAEDELGGSALKSAGSSERVHGTGHTAHHSGSEHGSSERHDSAPHEAASAAPVPAQPSVDPSDDVLPKNPYE